MPLFARTMKSAAVSTIAVLFAVTSAAADCVVYQHRDYGGASFRLRDGDKMKMVNGEDLGCRGNCGRTFFRSAWNDQISSFKLDPGCTIHLYEHVNRQGGRLTRSYSLLYVGSAWNDKASEALCSCKG